MSTCSMARRHMRFFGLSGLPFVQPVCTMGEHQALSKGHLVLPRCLSFGNSCIRLFCEQFVRISDRRSEIRPSLPLRAVNDDV